MKLILILLDQEYIVHTVKFMHSLGICNIIQAVFITREGFLRKIILAVSFFQNCAIHQYT